MLSLLYSDRQGGSFGSPRQCSTLPSRRDGDSQLAWACSLDTTNIYAQANLETKRRALEKVNPSARPEVSRERLAARREHRPNLRPRSEEHTSELQSLAYLVC